MSYDVELFFRDANFPLEQWKEIISEFHPQEREICRSIYNLNVLAKWTISFNGGSLWLNLSDVRADNYFKPIPAQWAVSITRKGRHPHEAWLQFAVPYRALVLMQDVVFYDSQHGIKIEDEEEYLEFVSPKLQRFGLSKMFAIGLLDAHGKPRF